MRKDYQIYDSKEPADDIGLFRNHCINYFRQQRLTKAEQIEVVRSLDDYLHDDLGFMNVKGSLKRGD